MLTSLAFLAGDLRLTFLYLLSSHSAVDSLIIIQTAQTNVASASVARFFSFCRAAFVAEMRQDQMLQQSAEGLVTIGPLRAGVLLGPAAAAGAVALAVNGPGWMDESWTIEEQTD